MIRQVTTILFLGALLAGCGEKAQELKQGMEQMKNIAENADNIKETQNEQEQFIKERVAKGDTIAMPYAELQKFLPTSIDGYQLDGDPSGSQQSMAGFSMSNTEQHWVSTSGDSENPSRLKVTLTDWGGTSGAYGLAGLAFMLNLQAEDDTHRMSTHKMDLPYTYAVEEYQKQSKETKLTVGTRYRYLINIETENGGEDRTALLKDVATGIVKNLEGK